MKNIRWTVEDGIRPILCNIAFKGNGKWNIYLNIKGFKYVEDTMFQDSWIHEDSFNTAAEAFDDFRRRIWKQAIRSWP